MNDGRRALLLGAGSQIAPFLSHRLAESGWSGEALSRRSPPLTPPLHPAFAWRPHDAASPGLVLGAWDTVFSLLPLWLLPPLLPHLQGVRQIVAFSSTSVHSKASSPDPAERALAGRLAEAERELLAICQATGMGCSLLRPTLIYGSGRDRNICLIAQFIRRHGFFPVVSPGRGQRQPVHADDLATAATACLQLPAPQGLTLDLPGGETLTFREMVARVFAALGRRPVILPLPALLVRACSPWLARALPGGYSPALLLRMNQDLCFDATPASRAIGYRPRSFRLEPGLLGGDHRQPSKS